MKRLLTFGVVVLLASGVCLADDSVDEQERQRTEAHSESRANHDSYHSAASLYEMALAANDEEMDKGRQSYQQAQELYEQGAEGAHQRRRHLDQLRMLKLLQLLDLREDQEVEFMHAFRSLLREQREVQEDRKEAIDKLAAQLKEGSPTLGFVDRAIDQLRTLDERRSSARDRFFANARNILSPEQLGQLVVFQDRFEKEMLGNLREFQFRRQGELQEQYRGLRNDIEEDSKDQKRGKARR